MKKSIQCMQNALVLQLQYLFYSERKMINDFSSCGQYVQAPQLKAELNKYIESARNKLLKLERVFNYLLCEPTLRKNEIIIKYVDETRLMLSQSASPFIKDIVMIGCIQNINAYKISSYRTAGLLAAELELDTAADLLQQILKWETETAKVLSTLCIEIYNQIQKKQVNS